MCMLCVCVTATQVIVPLLLCRKVLACCPEASSGVESITAGRSHPYETSHCYIQIDERHREQQDFVSPSLRQATALSLAEKNMAALQIFSDIQRMCAAPAESLLAYPSCFWPDEVLWVFSEAIAAR